jgi:hypothetical protein
VAKTGRDSGSGHFVPKAPSEHVRGGQVKSPGAVNVPAKVVKNPTPPPPPSKSS